jgi:hypothetical protein
MKIFGYILILFFILFGIFLYFFGYSDTEAQSTEKQANSLVESGGKVVEKFPCKIAFEAGRPGIESDGRKYTNVKRIMATLPDQSILNLKDFQRNKNVMAYYDGYTNVSAYNCYLGQISRLPGDFQCCNEGIKDHKCYKSGKVFTNMLQTIVKFTSGSCEQKNSYSPEVEKFLNSNNVKQKTPYSDSLYNILDRIKFGNR